MLKSRFLVALAACLVASTATLSAQSGGIIFPAASPAATVQQRVGLTDFEIVYSRPSVKGREIFGGLQAYGEVWRTGANAATRITFGDDISFGGQAVAAGTYALFSIPGESRWTVILNQQAEQWGAFNYDAAEDVARVEVSIDASAEFRETLHIGFDNLRDESAELLIAWEDTEVRVPITVDVRSRLQPQIEAAMASGQPQRDFVYFQAANFYFEHRIDLDRAAEWIDLALEQNPNAYWMLHLKAKIHVELGNAETAIAAAEASTAAAVAQEGPNSGYRVMNDALIARVR